MLRTEKLELKTTACSLVGSFQEINGRAVETKSDPEKTQKAIAVPER